MPHVALVTGANRGLGREIARQLLARDLRVVLTGRDEAATHRVLEALGAAGKNALAVRLDVTDPASIAAARRTAEERFGPVDIVVNNAAVRGVPRVRAAHGGARLRARRQRVVGRGTVR
jgi:NAD(P)-dependent dehydrogenase (short-subunit alcohol dehydrogenase family)